MVDYKELLRKYLFKVGCEEGITFAPNMYDNMFTAEEVLAFKELEDLMFPPTEVREEFKRSVEYTNKMQKLMREDLNSITEAKIVNI